jgi:gas vesicle protein
VNNDTLLAIGIGVGALVGAAAAALLGGRRAPARRSGPQASNIRLTARPADTVARARAAAKAAVSAATAL